MEIWNNPLGVCILFSNIKFSSDTLAKQICQSSSFKVFRSQNAPPCNLSPCRSWWKREITAAHLAMLWETGVWCQGPRKLLAQPEKTSLPADVHGDTSGSGLSQLQFCWKFCASLLSRGQEVLSCLSAGRRWLSSPPAVCNPRRDSPRGLISNRRAVGQPAARERASIQRRPPPPPPLLIPPPPSFQSTSGDQWKTPRVRRVRAC